MRKPPETGDLFPAEKNQAAAEMGRKGGLKGGAARAARMTPEERRESARLAAAARWARVAAETAEADGGDEVDGGRKPKPFVFTLTPEEALFVSEAKGTGGQQTLHRRLQAQLAQGNLSISFTDAQLGELIRYMTRYGSGGFQDRLKRAFKRELSKLFSFLDEQEHG